MIGDGSEENPFESTFNPKCFKRHDSNLYISVCERDNGFMVSVIPIREGHVKYYKINIDGSFDDLSTEKNKIDEFKTMESNYERLFLALMEIAFTFPSSCGMNGNAYSSDPEYIKMRNNHMIIAQEALNAVNGITNVQLT